MCLLIVYDLKGVIPAGDTRFLLRGISQPQYFNWEKYGISFSAPEGILPLSETCEVAITALAGGEFEFPEDSELVSAVYGISISKPLLKPLTVSIQHCVLLETPEQCNSLQFMRAPIDDVTLPFQFKPLSGGHFTPGNRYGSISPSQFCLIGISLRESEEGGEENTSDEEDSSSQNSHNSEEENTSDEEDSSSQNSHKHDDPHISEDSETNENGQQISKYKGKITHLPNILLWCVYLFTESGKEVTDETNDDDNESGKHVSDNEGIYWSFIYILYRNSKWWG